MNSQDFYNLQEAYLSVYAPQELDELSVNKMLAYVEKGEKNRADLNKKWDKGTATHRERMRVLGREEGEARASDKVQKKTGKRPYEMNALDKARYAVTKEDYVDEEQSPIPRGTPMNKRWPYISNKDPEFQTALDRVNKKKSKKKRTQKEQVDTYDIILSHLLDEGYADTEQAAQAIMVNMSEDWRESIVETRMDPRGRPASGPMNVYGKSKPNTDPAFQAALKSYREKEAKKTPEQRKAELDDYKARQMNR